MRIRWTLTAADQLTAIRDYIARQSPHFAQRMAKRILSRCRQLRRFPTSGQMVPEYQDPTIRELIEGPYRILYKVEANHVSILRIFHGAQSLPSDPPE